MEQRALVLFAADPGPTRWGWSILVLLFTSAGCRIQWVDGGHDVWSTAFALRVLDRALDEARRHDADVLVTSEIVTGKVYAGRSDTNVLDTSRECGRLTPVAETVALLHGRGQLAASSPFPTIRTAEYTTAQWHAVLTGHRRGVTQEVVNLCVRGSVFGLPALPKTRDGIPFAEHVWDASAIAIASGYMARGRASVPLPAGVTAQVHQLVAAELDRQRQKAASNKIKRALGDIAQEAAGSRLKPRSRAEKKRRTTSALIAAARKTT